MSQSLQVGYFLEDLLLEVRAGGEGEVDWDGLEDTEEGSTAVAGFKYKWSQEEVGEEERLAAHRQVVGFLQMVDCVLAGLGGGHGSVAPGLAEKAGLWLDLVCGVGRAALQHSWREDLAITWLRCLVTATRLAVRAAVPRLTARTAATVDCVLVVAARAVTLSWAGQVGRH